MVERKKKEQKSNSLEVAKREKKPKVAKNRKEKVQEKEKKSVRKRNTKEQISSVMKSAENTEVPSAPSGPNAKTPMKLGKSPSSTTDEKSLDKKREEKSNDVKRKKASEEKDFKLQLAQIFVKQMMESQKSKKKGDSKLEVMPAPFEYVPPKTTRKKPPTRRKKPLDLRIFKPNGEPVWMASDRSNDDSMGQDQTRCPELINALEEDNIQLDSGRNWMSLMTEYTDNRLNNGKMDDKSSVDPFGPLEEMERRTATHFRMDSVIYYTLDNLFQINKRMFDKTIEQLEADEEVNTGERRRLAAEARLLREKMTKEDQCKTCIVTSISFDMDSTFTIRYDRRRPILSIQKFRKKYHNKVRQSAESGLRSEASREKENI